MKADQYKPKTLYVTYIVTTPKKVWAALTKPEFTKQYFFGRRVESDWKVGSVFRLWQANGTLDVEGKVMECDPPRLSKSQIRNPNLKIRNKFE